MNVEITQFIANWCVALYFIILLFERIMSLVKSIADKEISIFGTDFNRMVYALVIISIIGFFVLLFVYDRTYLSSLFTFDKSIHDAVNLKMLTVTVGVILISGMMHTEYTIPGIQFGAYGILILGMILMTTLYSPKAATWIGLAYVVAFSMAIPVVYKSEIQAAFAFHILEIIAALALIAVFSYMFYRIYAGTANNLFLFLPLAIMIILDALVLIFRWKEKVNGFVLVSAITAIVLWGIGKIVTLIAKQ